MAVAEYVSEMSLILTDRVVDPASFMTGYSEADTSMNITAFTPAAN